MIDFTLPVRARLTGGNLAYVSNLQGRLLAAVPHEDREIALARAAMIAHAVNNHDGLYQALSGLVAARGLTAFDEAMRQAQFALTLAESNELLPADYLALLAVCSVAGPALLAAFNLIDNPDACPIDSPEQHRMNVRRQVLEAQRAVAEAVAKAEGRNDA